MNSNPTKNNLISYITKNYSKFKFLLKTLHKKKLMTQEVFKYAINLTPKEFKQEVHKMPDKEYTSLVKKILELNKKTSKKSIRKMKGGEKVGRNSRFDCQNFYDDEQNCYQCPITLECLDSENILKSPAADGRCYNKVALCEWITQHQGSNPLRPDDRFDDNWVQENCQHARQWHNPRNTQAAMLLAGIVGSYAHMVHVVFSHGMPERLLTSWTGSIGTVVVAAVVFYLAAGGGEDMLPTYRGGKINSIKRAKKYSVKRKTQRKVRKRRKRRKTRKRKRRKSKRKRL